MWRSVTGCRVSRERLPAGPSRRNTMTMEILDGRREVSGGYKVDATRGQRVSRVSSEWFFAAGG